MTTARALLLLAGLIAGLVASACTADDDDGADAPTATIRTPGAGGTTPPINQDVAAESPSPAGDWPPRPIDFEASGARWVNLDPSSEADRQLAESLEQTFYSVPDDALWALLDADDAPYDLQQSPFEARAIGPSTGHAAEGRTVLVDLESTTVRRLLPFRARVARWVAPDLVLLDVDRERAASDGAEAWEPGRYELDLAAQTMTRRGDSRLDAVRHRLPEPLPDATWWPGASVVEVRRAAEGTDRRALVLIDPETGGERVLNDNVSVAAFSPAGRRAAVVTDDHLLIVYDFYASTSFRLGVPAFWGSPHWSPDGRYVAGSYQSLEGYETVIYDLDGFPNEEPERLGPYEDTVFAGWRPGGAEALLLGEYCLPGGIVLDRLFVDEATRREIRTEVRGFWSQRWSPDGDQIAVAAPGLPFGLIDPDTGLARPSDSLEGLITELQTFTWSADGRWIALRDMPPRDRCPG